MGTRKKSPAQIGKEQLAELDEEIGRLPGRGAPNVDPDKLMQSIMPRKRRRRGEKPPSREHVKAAEKALIERVNGLRKKDGGR